MKKIWKKPKLMVLYRGKPEESVLFICKANIASSMGPAKTKCKMPTGNASCNVQAVS